MNTERFEKACEVHIEGLNEHKIDGKRSVSAHRGSQ